jgi:hypothetical protein
MGVVYTLYQHCPQRESSPFYGLPRRGPGPLTAVKASSKIVVRSEHWIPLARE